MTALSVVPEAQEFTGEIHPYADRWPMLSADETEALAADIDANGLWHPIVLDPSGRLVDGRNRLAACDLADVPPAFVVDDRLTSEDVICAYIWSANGERRDMTKGQKAMLAALQPGRADLLSKSADVAHAYVSKARTVLQWCLYDTIEAVIAGTLPLNDAYAEAQQIKATEQAEEVARRRAEAEAKRAAEAAARRLADLRDSRPDLASLVDAGSLTLADALTVRDKELAAVRKAADQRTAWLRKLRDVFADVVTGIDSLSGPNTTADLMEALAEFPIDPMFKATSVDDLRPRVAAFAALLDAMEAADL